MRQLLLRFPAIVSLAAASASCITETHYEQVIRVTAPGRLEYRGRDVGEWTVLLSSADPVERRQVVAELADGADEALPVLARLLNVDSDIVREQTILLLARRGSKAVSIAAAAASSRRVDTRFYAARLLWTLTPDSVAAIPVLMELLDDGSWPVVAEAARALAALGPDATPAIPALIEVLDAWEWRVRRAAVSALAALGPMPPEACAPLIQALQDPQAAVRRGAADALGSVVTAEDKASAVAPLIEALEDDDVHVRVAAASALGSLGEAAAPARAALELAARIDPALEAEALWALERITGTVRAGQRQPPSATPPELHQGSAAAEGWSMLCGSPARNAVSLQPPLPTQWDVRTGRNVAWTAPLGKVTYGSPIVAGSRVFIGTDNAIPRDPKLSERGGVLLALDAANGDLAWQDMDRQRQGLESFLLDTTTSSPLVEGDRLWYVTAAGRLRCLDTQGFLDGENDGPRRDEGSTEARRADLIWELDLCLELGVFIHEAPNCSVVAAGELLMVCTSNGVDEAHVNVPAPHAPSFIGVDRRSGEVRWQVVGSSARAQHGQWSSPALGLVEGRLVAFFGGGDGRLYAIEAASGKELWQLDGNPAGALPRGRNEHPRLPSRNEIIACPVFDRGRVYVAMGQDPNHGKGRGAIHAIDVSGASAAGPRLLWTYDDVHRSIATPIVHDGLLYGADLEGIVHCVDAETGSRVWARDLQAPVWSALLLNGDALYVGDEDGAVTVLAAGRTERVLCRVELDAAIRGAFAAAGGTLYVATSRTLYALRESGDATAPSPATAEAAPAPRQGR